MTNARRSRPKRPALSRNDLKAEVRSGYLLRSGRRFPNGQLVEGLEEGLSLESASSTAACALQTALTEVSKGTAKAAGGGAEVTNLLGKRPFVVSERNNARFGIKTALISARIVLCVRVKAHE